MRTRITAFLGITLLILVISALSTSTAFAKGATDHITEMLASVDDGATFTEPVGHATLIVTNRTLAVSVHTTGLNPGHVYSVWGIINGSASHLAGRTSSGDGSLDFGGALKLDPNLDLESFVIKLKDHGEPIPGLVDEQRSTKGAGCGTSKCPTVQAAVFILVPPQNPE